MTTIVGCLVNLTNGQIVDTDSALNRQITYGEKVLTRIGFAQKPEGLATLQTAACESINAIISSIVGRTSIGSQDIIGMTIGANTVMNHIICGIDPTYPQMANADIDCRRIVRSAPEIGLAISQNAPVCCLPNVSRFIGGMQSGTSLFQEFSTAGN
ncbi:MAG: hypothetical protein A4E35_01760 [Methanoregula sp. PtaU1.Bin051]|nr:MAG: hypothetical protein A4E35_01760 [Methanoregula sp. PtaU1.Bin051]